MPQIDFRIDASFPRGIEEVGNQWKQIPILLSDLIEASEVYAESEGAIPFLDKQDRCTVRRPRWANEARSQVLVEELSECLGLGFQKRIHAAMWGKTPSGVTILRSYGRCGASEPALALLKTSAKSLTSGIGGLLVPSEAD